MNEHDQLCPDYGKHHNGMTITTEHCRCALIAKVRADEQEKAIARHTLQRERLRIVMRAHLRAKVKALPHDDCCALEDELVSNGRCTCLRSTVLDLIDGVES